MNKLKNIKLIASDLDYTLLNSNFEVSEFTNDIICKLLDKNFLFIPCTSRNIQELLDLLKNNSKIIYCVTSNGAKVYKNKVEIDDWNSQIYYEDAIKIILNAATMNQYWTCSVKGILYSNKLILDNHEKLEIRGDYLEKIIKQRVFVDSNELVNILKEYKYVEKIHFITSFMDRGSKENFINLVRVVSGILVSSSHPNNIEITNEYSTKGRALKKIMQLTNIKSYQAIACGDNINDISMMNEAKYKIAVANATEEVLKISNICALSCDEDGIAHCLYDLLL